MINQNLYLVKGKIHENWFKTNHTQKYLKNEWVKGYLEIANDRPGLWQYRVQPFETYLYSFPVDPETICQCVGISTYWENDNKEAVEFLLWEHDLLEINYEGKTITTEVKRECGSFILVSDEFVDGYIPLLDVAELEETPWLRGKVVGNAIDNPELLNANYEMDRD